MNERERLHREIRQMAHEKQAVILAHNYQVPEVQDVADFVGDSLGLAREAARTDAQVIAMCGVYFMAETAKILNPEKTVLMPDPTAGCSLADSITAEDVRSWKAEFPGAVVVSYVNTTAAVKAESDYCVTSGNAEAVVRSIPSWQKILFLPDFFLGSWLKQTLGPGQHGDLARRVPRPRRHPPGRARGSRKAHSDADLLVHPECGCSSQYVFGKRRGMLDGRLDVHPLDRGDGDPRQAEPEGAVPGGDGGGHPASAGEGDPGEAVPGGRSGGGLQVHEADHAAEAAPDAARHVAGR